MAETSGRIVGIRHRVKKTKDEEARPTQVAILQGSQVIKYDLADEMAELDWVHGIFPTEFRPVEPTDSLDDVLVRHIRWRRLKKGENPGQFPTNLLVTRDKETYLALKVPIAYDGLKTGDTVALIMGGSGNYLTSGLALQAAKIGAAVIRTPAYRLKEARESASRTKDEDALTLAEMARDKRGLFYNVRQADHDLIQLDDLLQARIDAMKARIGCEQRTIQIALGRVFRLTGADPPVTVTEQIAKEKAGDAGLQAAVKEEERRERDLVKHLGKIPIYREVFDPIEGVGPMTAARLICAAQDIRRFPTKAKFKAFCGVHVLPDGRFPRRRSGERSNWDPEARQALWLLGLQFNYRPDSEWGQKLLHYKKHFRQVHPEVETENGKKRYTDAHIHKMALWRTFTKLAEKIFTTWWRLERESQSATAA